MNIIRSKLTFFFLVAVIPSSTLAGKIVTFQSDGTFAVTRDAKYVDGYTEVRFPHGHKIAVTDLGNKMIHEEHFVDGSSITKETYSRKPINNTVTLVLSDGTQVVMRPDSDKDEGLFRVEQRNPDHSVIKVKAFNPEGSGQIRGKVRSLDSKSVELPLQVIRSKRGLWMFGLPDAPALPEAEALRLYDLDQAFRRAHEHEVQKAFSAEPQTPLSPDASLPPPSSESFDEHKPECEDWALAHKLYCGDEEYEAAKAVLHFTRFITTNEMKAKLDVLVSDFIHKIHGKKFAVLTIEGKSSSWLADLYRNQLLEAGGQIVQFEDRRRLEPIRHVYDSGIKDYLIIEDGLYSGAQMRDTLIDIESYLGHDAQNANLHILSFATTEKANEMIRGSAPPVHVEIIAVETIHPLRSLTTAQGASTLAQMYPYQRDYPSIFFEHKIPDLWSSLVAQIEPGKVYCKDGERPEPLAKISFQCFPDVIPPYKKRPTYNGEKICSGMKWNSPFCIDYFNAKVQALKRLDDYRRQH